MKPRKWTYDKCKDEISKMVYLKEINGTGLLNAIKKYGWYDELTEHLIKFKKKYWTKEEIIEEAKKYKHKIDFSKKNNAAYLYACRRGWWEEISSHMIPKCGWRKGESRWTKSMVLESAKKYNTRTEFNRGRKKGSTEVDYESKYAAEIAKKYGWYDDVCSHMTQNINKRPRYIYVLIWEEYKMAYVGLTQDTKDRFYEHNKNTEGVVYKTIKRYGTPIYKVLTKNPLNVNSAGDYEERWKVKYEKMGYHLINISKTGALGSYSRVWTYEMVKKEALKYTKRSDFHRNSGGASLSARKNGWLDDVCSHMELIMGRWDVFENVKSESLKYKTRKDFTRGCRAASEGAYRNKWMNILYPIKKGNMGYWNIKENVMEAALKCKTRSEFNKLFLGAYKSALRNGWMDKLFPSSKSNPL